MMIDPQDADPMIEGALTAWRPRALDGRVLPHPAWADMDAEERRRLFEEGLGLREMEAALDRGGLSTTGRSILNRILRGGRP